MHDDSFAKSPNLTRRLNVIEEKLDLVLLALNVPQDASKGYQRSEEPSSAYSDRSMSIEGDSCASRNSSSESSEGINETSEY